MLDLMITSYKLTTNVWSYLQEYKQHLVDYTYNKGTTVLHGQVLCYLHLWCHLLKVCLPFLKFSLCVPFYSCVSCPPFLSKVFEFQILIPAIWKQAQSRVKGQIQFYNWKVTFWQYKCAALKYSTKIEWQLLNC